MSSPTPPEPPRGPFGRSDPSSRGPFGPSGRDRAGDGRGDDDRGRGWNDDRDRGRAAGPAAGGPRPGLPGVLGLLRRRRAPAAGGGSRSRSWRTRLVLLAVGAVGALAVYGITRELPRWWALEVGGAVDKNLGAGIVTGLFVGVVFTLLPIAAARLPLRPGLRLRTRALLVLVVLALATPNLLTLTIELGSDAAAVYGRRVLDVSAPGFRSASLFGVLASLVGVVLARTADAVLPGGRTSGAPADRRTNG